MVTQNVTITATKGFDEIPAVNNLSADDLFLIRQNGEVKDAKYEIFNDDLNVKLFGARGDGNTDDTQAIQACIAYALSRDVQNQQTSNESRRGSKRIFFPKGVYRISRTINLHKFNGINVVGQGKESTTLCYVRNSPGGEEILFDCDQTIDIAFKDMEICTGVISNIGQLQTPQITITSNDQTRNVIAFQWKNQTQGAGNKGYLFDNVNFSGGFKKVFDIQNTTNRSEHTYNKIKCKNNDNLLTVDNIQAVNFTFFDPDIILNDVSIFDFKAGGNLRVFGGNFVNSCDFLRLNDSSHGVGIGPNNGNFSFYGIRFEFQDSDQPSGIPHLVKCITPTFSKIKFEDCNANIDADASKRIMDLNGNFEVVLDNSSFTGVISGIPFSRDSKLTLRNIMSIRQPSIVTLEKESSGKMRKVLIHNEDAQNDSVKLFGAKGDGVTDDTQSIATALSSLSSVSFPYGTYVLSDSAALVFDNSKVYSNENATILVKTKTLNGTTVAYPGAFHITDINGSTIQGLNFKGTGVESEIVVPLLSGGAKGAVIVGNNSSDVRILNNTFNDFTLSSADVGNLISFTNTDGFVASKNTILSSVSAGGSFIEVSNNVKNIILSDNISHGISDLSANVFDQVNGNLTVVGNISATDQLNIGTKTIATSSQTGSLSTNVTGDVYIGSSSQASGIDRTLHGIASGSSIGSIFEIANGNDDALSGAQARLHLVGSSTDDGVGALAFFKTGESAFGGIHGFNTGVGAGNLEFKTDDGTTHSTKMTISGNGNVGIGTTTPESNLHVQSLTGDTKLIIEADPNNSNEDDNPILIFRRDGGLEETAIWTGASSPGVNDNSLNLANASRQLFNGEGGIKFFTINAPSSPVIDYTAAIERMIINPDGKVGIGTPTPTTTLTVSGGLSAHGLTHFGSFTTTVRDAAAGVNNGTVIYNTTTNKFQGYANGVWVDFH